MSENILGNALRDLRERSGLSVMEVAARVNVDRVYLHKLEGQVADWLNRPLYGGRVKQPSRDLIIRLALAFRLNVGEADELLLMAGYAPLSARLRDHAWEK